MARVASCTTEVALTTSGSTNVGSPTLAAWATSGCFWKLPITLETVLASRRLSSSALFCAIAALVGRGMG